MRVVAGSAKGRVLATPKGARVRPTLQYVKESLFNIVADRVHSAVVLDLFAGSGSLGIEALSRGAEKCVFVDSDLRCVQTIERNLASTRLSDRARIYRMSVYRAIRMLQQSSLQYSLVFADPPYEMGHEHRLLSSLGESSILASGSMVVLEHSCRTETPVQLGRLKRESVREYGDTHVSLYVSTVEGEV